MASILKHIKDFYKENPFLAPLASFTFVAILTTGIIFKQKFLFLLPLFVSLVVMVLQAKVNRYALLLGALNSLLYAYYNYSIGLMSSALSCVLQSFPLQLISFFTWSRRSRGTVTRLKRLKLWQMAVVAALFVGGWAALFFGISLINGAQKTLLDTLVTVMGLTTSILTLLCFSEYVFFQLTGCVFSIVLSTQVVITEGAAHVGYLIYVVYSAICVLLAAIKLFRKSKAASANVLSDEDLLAEQKRLNESAH